MSNIEIKKISSKKTIAGFDGNIWLTITEVSYLNGLNVATIRESCAEREGSYRGGRYIFRKIGKRYEILLTSLPESIQAEYWLKHHKPANSTLPVLKHKQENHPFDAEVYEAIADQYSRKAAGIKEEAQRRVYILDEYLKLLKGGFKRKKALEIIESHYKDISRATLWRWEQRIAKHPRQYWEVMLAPDHKGRSRTEIHPDAWFFFRREYGQLSEPDATAIYRETVKAAVQNGWGELPSCRTFLRRWEDDVPENEKILLRKGRTALKESLPHLKRDYTTRAVHEVWESDGRKADVFCLWPDGTIDRPWCVVIRDIRTRMPLAIKVYRTTNAELVIDAFRNAVLLTGTIPTYFHIDNGPEYSNNPFTGGQKSPFRYTVIKNQPIGVLTRLGVEPLWATPYHGAAKAIESWWNVIAKMLISYVELLIQVPIL
ncbi:DNA-binding domain-containing protein [Nitrosomonas sp. Nm166]|uniref:DNA-binding domain-containing protein n=1 Tax=Nitrosomonas sp. Nm166 TaxID=1881054 RepID=UPI0008E66B32|nr:DNA-binding domain-containing protein [Nitrosomonas sp. Nm166]SFF12454.1 Bacteriophage Mu transposase [Nitrosomonas sp. Nm166]